MNQLIDIISRWDHFGQGLFFLMVILSGVGLIRMSYQFILVLFRGWPPGKVSDD